MACLLDEIRTYQSDAGTIVMYYPSIAPRTGGSTRLLTYHVPGVRDGFWYDYLFPHQIEHMISLGRWRDMNDKSERNIEVSSSSIALDDILTYWSADTRNRIIVHPFAAFDEQDREFVHHVNAMGDVDVTMWRTAETGAHALMRVCGYWRLMNDSIERMTSDDIIETINIYRISNPDGMHDDRIEKLQREIDIRRDASKLRRYRTI